MPTPRFLLRRDTGAVSHYWPVLTGEFGTLDFTLQQSTITDAAINGWTGIPLFAQPVMAPGGKAVAMETANHRAMMVNFV